MVTHTSASVKERKHYFENRDFDLASKVAALPDSAFVSPHEVAAITGIAVTSFQKPSQRTAIGMPEPRVLGRLLKWQLSDIRAWLKVTAAPTPARPTPSSTRRGRPTKAEQLARQDKTTETAERSY